MYCQCKTSPEP